MTLCLIASVAHIQRIKYIHKLLTYRLLPTVDYSSSKIVLFQAL